MFPGKSSICIKYLLWNIPGVVQFVYDKDNDAIFALCDPQAALLAEDIDWPNYQKDQK